MSTFANITLPKAIAYLSIGMALEGKAPKVFTKTNRIGVPYNCVIAVLLICLLAFLQVSAGSAKVLGWFVNL